MTNNTDCLKELFTMNFHEMNIEKALDSF